MTIYLHIFFLFCLITSIAASPTQNKKNTRSSHPRLEEGAMTAPPSFGSSRPTAHLLSPRSDDRPGENSGSYFPSDSGRPLQQQQGPQSPSAPRSPYTHSTMARDANTRPFLAKHVTSASASGVMIQGQGGMLSPSVPMYSPAYQQSPPQIVQRRVPSSPSGIQRPIRSAPEVVMNPPRQIVCPLCMLHFSRVDLLQAHLNVHR